MKIRMIFCLNFLIFCVLNGVCQDNSNLESYLANAGDSGTFNQSKISGSLLNFIPGLNKDLVVKYVVTIPGLQNQVIKKIELKEDGSFEIIIEKAMPYQLVWLTIGDYYSGKVILNSSLEIKADLKVLEKSPVELIGKGITFSGEDGGLTTYVNEYAKFNVPKKIKLNKEKFNILMNRTAQPVYKEKLLSEHYDLLAKIEKDFSRKKGKEYAWFLENERLTEMHTDYMSIYLGREIEEKIWNQALEHSPKTMTSYTNQFYDVMAYFVSNPTENQMRKLRKKIYITDATNAEEVDKLNNFLKEMDKRSAGLSYDNEIYANGLEEYVKKYENLLEKAKLENMTSILQ